MSPPSGSRLRVDLPPGGQVLVLGELSGQGPEDTRLAAEVLTGRLAQLEGPGVVVLTSRCPKLAALQADLAQRAGFLDRPERRLLWLRPLPSSPDPGGVGEAPGEPPLPPRLETAEAAELWVPLPGGPSRVLLLAGPPATGNSGPGEPGGASRHRGGPLGGLELCPNRETARRFVASRLTYRRFVPLVGVLGTLALVLAGLRPGLWHGLLLTLSRMPQHRHALPPAWLAGTVAGLGILVLAGAVAALGARGARRLTRELPTTPAGTLDGPERAGPVETFAGVIQGGAADPVLRTQDARLEGAPGTTGRVLEARPAVLGLPTVFEVVEQVSWVELEVGAQLHGRLLAVRRSLASRSGGLSPVERLVSGRRGADLAPEVLDAHPLAGTDLAASGATPVVLAALPHGPAWPRAADDGRQRRQRRRLRRLAAAALALAGLLDLLSAAHPPLAQHLDPVLTVLPLGVAQTAGALEVLAGIGLLALARGVRRGQRRAWRVASGLLAGSLVLHALRGGEPIAFLVGVVVLGLLLTGRHAFGARADLPSLRTAVRAVGGGLAVVVGAAWAAVALQGHLDRDGRAPLPAGQALLAVLERLWGLQSIALPGRLNGFLSPSLLSVGLSATALAALLATRPVVDRARHSSSGEHRARELVSRHGRGSLDYFALRRDKRLFFHGESFVAYRHLGGVCLVSPDPVGPLAERRAVWAAFRRFADAQGWTVAVLGAGPSWLPVYRAASMRAVYLGDEAVVDVPSFSLAGKQMKGLRQACTRVARFGYRVRICHPGELTRQERAALLRLAVEARTGNQERGFSMMLGRFCALEDPEVLLSIVQDSEGRPVALCQFVPAPGIGGYSLDVTRRQRGPHPNGLVDFALVATIEHLRATGASGLSLNFATLRAVLAEEHGAGPLVGLQRWVLLRLSRVFQIESLWRFTAKYRPRWVPRYLCLEDPEHLLPTLLALVRAEGLWDLPGIGRLVAAGRRLGAQGRTSKVA